MTKHLLELLQYRRNDQISEYRNGLKQLTQEEKVELDLYLRKIALGEVTEKLMGYPSLDKVWLKYYKEADIKADIPHLTAIEYLKKLNEDNLTQTAINSPDSDGIFTYGELFSRIDQVAQSLHKVGVCKGHVIMGVLPPMTAHEVYLLYAADMVGAAVNFMAGGTPITEICNQINMFNVDYLFVFDDYLDAEAEEQIYTHTKAKQIVVVNLTSENYQNKNTVSWQAFLDIGKGYKLPAINRKPEDLLFIAKTGGTTGKPKNVMLSDDCFNITVHQFLHSDLNSNYCAGDKWLRLWSLFSATAAVSSSHLPLCVGMENVLRTLPPPEYLDKLIAQEKPNHILLIPIFLDWLEKSTLLATDSLNYVKTVGVGGVSITENFEHRAENFFAQHSLPIYLGCGWGCTESASSAAIRMNHQTTIVGTVGVPLVKTSVSAFDPSTGIELGYGEEGELCIMSPALMMGYYNESELSKQALRLHQDGCTWLHTGDLGYIDRDGIVRITGRMTRSIFPFMGPKVYPTQMEELVAKVPGVRETVVVGIPDTRHESFEIPICFITVDSGFIPDRVAKDVVELCEINYPEPARPKHVYVKSSFPTTPIGKPDIKLLEQEAKRLPSIDMA